MKFPELIFILLLIISEFSGCNMGERRSSSKINIRHLVDTVGFAHYTWQMDTLMARIDREGWNRTQGKPWKLVICPHDDYSYVGKLYPETLNNVTAKNLILIGVAHKAASLGIENVLVFDNFKFWKGPWGNVEISPAREEIRELLGDRFSIVSDTLHSVEHSLEALIPYLQYFNKKISIIPILVTAMSPDRMDECGRGLADAIRAVSERHKWEWGRDFSIVVTTDAVHYGNVDWNGSDYAFFGCDDNGNRKALVHETEIIDNCLTGNVSPNNIRRFSSYTLKDDDFRKYKWTWCGRYSVPVGLYAAFYLNNSNPVNGELIGYSTSITARHIPVDDIQMGTTAIAVPCHWVGYAAIGYR